MTDVRLLGRVGALVVAASLAASCAAPGGPAGDVDAVAATPPGTATSGVPAAAASGVAGPSAGPSAAPTGMDQTHPATASTPGSASSGVLTPGTVNATTLDVQATYDAKVTLHYGDRLIAVDSWAVVKNVSGSAIDRLELNTIAARLGGGIRITASSVDDRPVKVTVTDQTLLVPLGGVLRDGGTVRVRIAYRAHLRADLAGSNWMFTRVNGIVSVYRWLPWVSRRVAFNRPNHGDPFITPVSSSVRVAITTDRTMVFATTGDRVAVNGLTQTFEASNVRDFTITASPFYRTTSAVVGGTTVRVYYRTGAPAATMLSAAKNAISKMSALVGAYPYKTFKVAQSSGGYGMESPALIWIPTGSSTANLRYLVTHEIAHQWFYGMVGSDQANEPYTDEAVTDFVARYVLSMRRASRCATARLDLSIYKYSSACYYEVVYIQGGNFLDDLRKRMGSTAFWSALKGYVTANRYKLVATKALLTALDDATSLDLVPRYEPRFPRLYG